MVQNHAEKNSVKARQSVTGETYSIALNAIRVDLERVRKTEALLEFADSWVSLERLIHQSIFSINDGWVQRQGEEYHSPEDWVFENKDLGVWFRVMAEYSDGRSKNPFEGKLVDQTLYLLFQGKDEGAVISEPFSCKDGSRLVGITLGKIERVLERLSEGKQLALAVEEYQDSQWYKFQRHIRSVSHSMPGDWHTLQEEGSNFAQETVIRANGAESTIPVVERGSQYTVLVRNASGNLASEEAMFVGSVFVELYQDEFFCEHCKSLGEWNNRSIISCKECSEVSLLERKELEPSGTKLEFYDKVYTATLGTLSRGYGWISKDQARISEEILKEYTRTGGIGFPEGDSSFSSQPFEGFSGGFESFGQKTSMSRKIRKLAGGGFGGPLPEKKPRRGLFGRKG